MKPFVKHLIGVNLSICMLAAITVSASWINDAQGASTDNSIPTSSVTTNSTTEEMTINLKVDNTEETIEFLNKTPETITNTIENREPEQIPEATQNPMETAKPQATQQPIATAKPVETEKPVETAKPVATTKPQATAKPQTTTKPVETTKPQATTKPTTTMQPQVSYEKVNKVTIANDPVAAEVSLDYKVPANLKAAYTTIKNALSKPVSKQTIQLPSTITYQELNDVLYYVKNYNPQMFYVDFNQYIYGLENGKVASVTLTCTASAAEYNQLEAVANKVVAEANKKANLFEREVYIHDWLVKNVKYDASSQSSYTAYGAIVEGKAGCEGYARAFQYLANKVGIETVLISGSVDGSHMWNMVKLYGEYYFVDVTHDDPAPDATIKDGQEYKINRSCLNVSTKIIEQTHDIDAKNSRSPEGFLLNADLQTCTATKYQYYNVRGLSVSNMSQLKYVLNENKAVPNIEVFFQGTMPDLDEAVEAFKEFMEEQYPGENYYYATTAESASSYQRNVIRFTWMTK